MTLKQKRKMIRRLNWACWLNFTAFVLTICRFDVNTSIGLTMLIITASSCGTAVTIASFDERYASDDSSSSPYQAYGTWE